MGGADLPGQQEDAQVGDDDEEEQHGDGRQGVLLAVPVRVRQGLGVRRVDGAG